MRGTNASIHFECEQFDRMAGYERHADELSASWQPNFTPGGEKLEQPYADFTKFRTVTRVTPGFFNRSARSSDGNALCRVDASHVDWRAATGRRCRSNFSPRISARTGATLAFLHVDSQGLAASPCASRLHARDLLRRAFLHLRNFF